MRQWRKSSHSGSGSNCVEVACGDGTMAIRDSKQPAAGHLTLPTPSVQALLTLLKDDVA